MALTIKPITRNGKLVVYDDKNVIIATGRAIPSQTEPAYITLTIRYNDKAGMPGSLRTQVYRVPISWFLALRDLPDPEQDLELR